MGQPMAFLFVPLFAQRTEGHLPGDTVRCDPVVSLNGSDGSFRLFIIAAVQRQLLLPADQEALQNFHLSSAGTFLQRLDRRFRFGTIDAVRNHAKSLLQRLHQRPFGLCSKQSVRS